MVHIGTAPVLGSAVIAAVLLGCRADSPGEPSPADPSAALSAQASALPSAPLFRQVSAGGNVGGSDGAYTCGVTTDYRAFCWGSNFQGQLGIGIENGPETCGGQESCSTRPALVAGGHAFRVVTVGWGHTCGLTTDDRAFCWGNNWGGQLGDGTTTRRMVPVGVKGGLRFRQIEAGANHTCGVTYPDDRVYCWGWNFYGMLGDGTTAARLKPVPLLGSRRFRQVSGGLWHTCGVTTDNVAFCWGRNDKGQIGDSTSAAKRLSPTRVSGTHRFHQVAAGENHVCAVTISSTAFCWGEGRQGQLGNGKQYLSFWPRKVAGNVAWSAVTAGEDGTCGLTPDSQAFCWGDHRTTPTTVPGGLLFGQLSVGNYHQCGRTTANIAYCWGSNFTGALGDGTTEGHDAPTPVVGPL